MILGIYDGHDAGIVTEDLWINEERLSRIKYHRGFPFHCMDLVEDAQKIGVAGIFRRKKRIDELNKGLSKIKNFKDKVLLLDHHLCHAASSYFTSGFSQCVAVTIDAAGDGLSCTINLCKKKKIERVYQSNYLDSLGDYFANIVELLGYKPMKDEGKIMVLSQYGKPKYLDFFKKNFSLKKFSFNNKLGVGRVDKIKKEFRYKIPHKNIKNFSGDIELALDLCASIQKFLEEVVLKLIENCWDEFAIKKFCFSGGVFQNVLLNMRINELLRNFWIFPNMGDGGLAFGAYAYCKNIFEKIKMKRLENVYRGLEYDVLKFLKEKNLKYREISEDEVAELISKGFSVLLFQKKMEYGPRALGNRSILSNPSKKGIKKRLNKSLGRESFQPFAPTILEERMKDYLINPHKNKFMTCSFRVTENAEKELKNCLHFGTARPQILEKKDNPRFYSIIKEFENLTGIGGVLNTSLNLHGEPIVCSPEHAYNTFRRANLDFLVFENYVVEA